MCAQPEPQAASVQFQLQMCKDNGNHEIVMTHCRHENLHDTVLCACTAGTVCSLNGDGVLLAVSLNSHLKLLASLKS